ncbi:hypothetical protein NPIL_470921 [Nephila pilipes]|uniref:Uncharacterized protein n=1 Tax=Nephila pilipes TaxID=299642 RepID=A0A8X6QXJ7_NEPPI|nr:hypothetical protein NPIL_470921 [Nephila pilipes]
MLQTGYYAQELTQGKRIEENEEVNAASFQENEIDINDLGIPLLHGANSSKFGMPIDKSSSHFAKLSLRYYDRNAAETGIRMILFTQVPVKLLDNSPMHYKFVGFNWLNQCLSAFSSCPKIAKIYTLESISKILIS